MATNPEQFRGLEPGFYITKGNRTAPWAGQDEVKYTYQDELGYGATLDVGDRSRMEIPTMTKGQATLPSTLADSGEAFDYGDDTDGNTQGALFRPGSHPRAHTFHGNYRGRLNSARLGVLAGLQEMQNTGPLDVNSGMSYLSRNMTLKVAEAAQRHGIDFLGNMEEQSTDNPAADWSDERRRSYASHGRGWTSSWEYDEEGNRKPDVEVPNALYIAGANAAPESNPVRFQEELDVQREKQEYRLTPREGGGFQGVPGTDPALEAQMVKFTDSQVKEAFDFTRAIFSTPKPAPAPEHILQRHEITDKSEDLEDDWGRAIEPSTNRRSLPGQGALDFPEWTPLERALTAGRNRARGELKAMARKNTRRPSQREQPTMSQPAPTVSESTEAAEFAENLRQGYNANTDALSDTSIEDEVEESYSQGYDHGITDSGVVDPVEEGALYGETLDPDIFNRPLRNPLG